MFYLKLKPKLQILTQTYDSNALLRAYTVQFQQREVFSIVQLAPKLSVYCLPSV